MGTLKTYQIDLKSLSLADTYKIEYVLDNGFFESVDGPEVRQGKVNVSLSIVRMSSAFELGFRIKGVVTVSCDRCLEDMEIPVETINRLIVTFGETYTETSDEQVIISEEEGFINVAWYMYEFIALAIPIKHVHEPGECNEVMASKLKELCVDDVSEDGEISEDDDSEFSDEEDSEFSEDKGRETSGHEKGGKPADPRWEALRNLIGDN